MTRPARERFQLFSPTLTRRQGRMIQRSSGLTLISGVKVSTISLSTPAPIQMVCTTPQTRTDIATTLMTQTLITHLKTARGIMAEVLCSSPGTTTWVLSHRHTTSMNLMERARSLKTQTSSLMTQMYFGPAPCGST